MKAELIKKEGNKVTLKITVDNNKFEAAVNKAYNKSRNKYNIPGFRKGKAPRIVIETQYGKGIFYNDAIEILFPEVYPEAIKELDIDPIDNPDLDIEEISKDNGLVMVLNVEVKPEFELGNYKGIEIAKVENTLSDENVDAKLQEMVEKNARLVSVEDKALEDGDTAIIDFEGFENGVAFDGGKGENYNLVIGSNTFIPGFEEQLVGSKAGQTVDVNVTFPEDYQAEDLAGKDAKFVTTIHEVKTKEVPALDDELAKDIDDEVETLDELKAKYRKELESAKEIAFDDAVEGAAIELAVANAEIVELPEEMVHDEVHRAMNEFMGNMQRQGISPEMYFQLTGTTEEDLHKQYQADADKRVKTNLVIEAIAAAEGFEATDEEIEKEITDLASEYNMEADQVRGLLSADMLKHDIAMKKAVDVITSSATVK